MKGKGIENRPVKSGIRGIVTALFLILSCTAVHAETMLLSNVPDYAWQYGCSPTSATMLAAYYADNGHDGLSYSNLMPGFSSVPLNSFSDPSVVDSVINTMATDMGTDKGAPASPAGTGDTTFWYLTNGAEWTVADDLAYGYTPSLEDGLYEYVTNAGYHITTSDVFNQLIYGYNGNTQGFTFAQYENQINQGMPLLIELNGHTMLGYGYSNDGGSDTVYVHDTWNSGGGSMTWGGSYGGYDMVAVTDLLIEGGSPSSVPEPCTLLLLCSGMIVFSGPYFRSKFQNRV